MTSFDFLLLDIQEYLERHADVRDGGDGKLLPNRAMQLLNELESYLSGRSDIFTGSTTEGVNHG